jgi:hypothetical protein
MRRVAAAVGALVAIKLAVLLVRLTIWVLYNGLSADYRVYGIVGILVVAFLPALFLISWWVRRLRIARYRRRLYGITPELRKRLKGSMVSH